MMKNNPWLYWRIMLSILILFMGTGFLFVHGIFPFTSRGHISQFIGYQVVFLDNGHIYFGEITDIKGGFIDLTHVYYFQGSAGGANVSNLTIVPMTTTSFSPKNQISINVSHVIFYQNLRSDSKVVQIIAAHEGIPAE